MLRFLVFLVVGIFFTAPASAQVYTRQPYAAKSYHAQPYGYNSASDSRENGADTSSQGSYFGNDSRSDAAPVSQTQCYNECIAHGAATDMCKDQCYSNAEADSSSVVSPSEHKVMPGMVLPSEEPTVASPGKISSMPAVNFDCFRECRHKDVSYDDCSDLCATK